MSDPDVSTDVRQFLIGNIRSIEQLEILLLLRASADRPWTAREVYQRVLTNETSVQKSLEKLREQRLVQVEGESAYRFVSSVETHDVLEKLARLYKEKPARIIYALYGPEHSELDAFAQAFKLRQPE
jgi:predicted transcriptional regulator